jgi:hypothetical protein
VLHSLYRRWTSLTQRRLHPAHPRLDPDPATATPGRFELADPFRFAKVLPTTPLAIATHLTYARFTDAQEGQVLAPNPA